MENAPYPGNAPPVNYEKPYRVTVYRLVRSQVCNLRVHGDYKKYWQANLVSFILHHVFGFGCNTWVAKK